MNQERSEKRRLKSLCIFFVIAALPAKTDAMDQRANDEVSCRVVEAAARAKQLPVAILTRLLWYESRFQVRVVSPAGAQGIAQFLPATANERGLWNPFDPELAITQAAEFLAELEQRFRNMGLAIAAYNAGPGRVANWLDKADSLPHETSRLVLAVTGRAADEWAASGPDVHLRLTPEPQSCIELRALLRSVSLDDLTSAGGHLARGMDQSGRPLPGMKQSGQPLPEWQQSGRLLPGIGQVGRQR